MTDDQREPDSVRTFDRSREREERRLSIAGSYAAARRAIGWVRAYRREPTTSGRRERECLAEVARLRSAIAELRAADRQDEGRSMPGVRKVEPVAQSTSSRTG